MKFLMFYEAEIAAMNPIAADAFKQVMDDRIAGKLLDLFNSDEYAQAKETHICARTFQQFEEYMYPLVFPIKLIENLKTTKLSNSSITYMELLFRMDFDQETLDYVYNPREIVEEILALLKNINLNGDKIPTEYTPRRKSDYEEFYESMKALNVHAQLLANEFNIMKNPNFLRDIASNKKMFYVPGEAKRPTGFLGIASKKPKLAQIYNGLSYQFYLKEKGISRKDGRVFI